MKDGKVSIGKKHAANATQTLFGSVLEVPTPILDYLKKIGHGYKYINTKQMRDRGGMIRNGWVPLKIPEDVRAEIPSNPFAPAEAKDYHVVGDLVLASKPRQQVEAHRKYLNDKTELQTESVYNQVDGKGKKMLYERGE